MANLLKNELIKALSFIKKRLGKNEKANTLSISSYLILTTIEEKGEVCGDGKTAIKISDLREALKMSDAALAKQTKKMVKEGLIEKFSSSIDHRYKYLVITEYGRTRLQNKTETKLELPDSLIDNLAEEEVKHLVALLNEATQIMNKGLKKGEEHEDNYSK